jgi:hypothetical protein
MPVCRHGLACRPSSNAGLRFDFSPWPGVLDLLSLSSFEDIFDTIGCREISKELSTSLCIWTYSLVGLKHQLLNIFLKLRILVLLSMSTLPYVVKVKKYF